MLSALQVFLNNLINTFIERALNEIMYNFKVREVFFALTFIAVIKININKERFRHKTKVANVTFYAFVKFKIYYDFKHISFMLKSDEKTFLRLNHEYKLFKDNVKLFNQRTKLFLIKRRIKRLTYELKLSSQ